MKDEKLKRFARDEAMSSAVYDVLLQAFLKRTSPAEVQLLAAQMLAVEKLKEAWKELERYKEDTEDDLRKVEQVGL